MDILLQNFRTYIEEYLRDGKKNKKEKEKVYEISKNFPSF